MGYRPLVDFHHFCLTKRLVPYYSQRHLANRNAIYILHR
jgi:hypothetical protein